MGINHKHPTGLASALFSTTQQRLLALLFGQPERRYYLTELIELAQIGRGTVQRELKRLTSSGLILLKKEGRQAYYQANPDSPLFNELHSLVLKTVGLVLPMQAALAVISDRIQFAFIYGSVAKSQDHAGSDIDLMIVADDLTLGEVYEALQQAQIKLARPISPELFTQKEFKEKINAQNSFIKKILAQPKLMLIGNENEL